jgi:CubicO group peptidase (beta-lactamase class C family)
MSSRIVTYTIVSIILIGLVSSCVDSESRQSGYWPDTEWRTSTPEEQGIESASILAMLQEIQQKDLNVHSVLIIRNGYLVAEVYFPPYTREIRHPLMSINKSVTSAMTGIAIDDDYIESIKQNVLDYYPEIAEETNDEYLEELTIEHLLTMSAGFNTQTLPSLEGKDSSFDVAEYILTNSNILWEPGETFFYDPGMPHILSDIIQKTSGLTLEAYAQTRLFGPLGITDYSWQSDPQGVSLGNSGLSLRPQDMAKFGYLYLHYGHWGGEQIVPEKWMQESTTKHMETKGLMNTAEDDGYGYYWWIDSFGGFSAHGYGGQYIFVVPGLDMIVVFTGGFGDPDFPTPHRLLKTYLLPAAKSEQPLADNPQAFKQLMEEITKIQDPEKPLSQLPDIARQISGKPFRVIGEPVTIWPEQITLTFRDGDTYESIMVFGTGETIDLNGGLNNVFYMNELGSGGEIIHPLRGYWQDDHTFIEERNFDLYSDIQFTIVTYVFEDQEVNITLESRMGSLPILRATGEMID